LTINAKNAMYSYGSPFFIKITRAPALAGIVPIFKNNEMIKKWRKLIFSLK